MKIQHILLSALMILSFSSCSLERLDYSKLEESMFYQDERDCKAALANLYTPFSTGHGGLINGIGQNSLPIFSEFATDILYCYWGYDIIHDHLYDQYTIGNYVNIFDFGRLLSICQGTILRIRNSNINENIKAKYIAEAQAVHAYIALNIYTYMGPIPLLKDEDILNPQDVKYYPRPSDEEFVKIISDELEEAMPNLPDPDQTDWGRMHKGVARMMLLKLYMGEKQWEKAEKYAQEIIDMGCYALQPNYSDVFAVKNKRNSEVIFVNPRETGDPMLCNTWHANSLPNVFNSGTDQPKWGGYAIQWDFVHTFDPEDERLSGIVTEFIGTDGKKYNESNPGSAMRKGAVALKYDIDPDFIGNGSNHDIIVYRYADVLLSMAEILNEINGPCDEALEYFNKVHERAGLPEVTLPSTKEDFRHMIFVERGHELYCEGTRWADMVRMGEYAKWVGKVNPSLSPERVKFPIPNWYITEYKGILVQNPGY